MNVSVAMTTYNGEKYLDKQLDSILNQLGVDDELIISDDGSLDKTISIIEDYMINDKRIKLYKNNHKNVVLNFESAISKCKNDLIFLSDQDDIWCDNKVNTVKKHLDKSDYLLVLHNAKKINGFNDVLDEYLIKNMKHGIMRNLFLSSYWGCCMAFKKELVNDILPFPKNLVAHDQYIGIIAESKRKSKFISENLILHRVHERNVSKRLSLINKVKFRVNLLKCYFNV